MTGLHKQWWFLALVVLIIISALFFFLNIVALTRLGSAHIHSASELAGLLLSGCTGVYCATELGRCLRRLLPILSRAIAVPVILAGLMASFVWSVGGLPMARRSASTTVNPELALPAGYSKITTPAPSPR